jgi:hypothetical protein
MVRQPTSQQKSMLYVEIFPSGGVLPNRRKRGALLVGKLGIANEASRMEDRMLCNQVFDPLLGFLPERVVSRAKIGKFGLASKWRHFMR